MRSIGFASYIVNSRNLFFFSSVQPLNCNPPSVQSVEMVVDG